MLPATPLAPIGVTVSGDEGELFVLLVGAFLFGLYLVYDGFDTWKLSRLIQDTPTAKVRSMAVGRTELTGTVREADGVIDPPYTDADCVYVTWEAERRERHTDEDGHTHYTWDTVASGTEALAFFLEDATGKVLVRADLDDPEFDIQTDAFSRRVTYGRGEMPPEELGRYITGFRDREDATQTAEDDGGLLDGAFDSVSDFLETDNPLIDTHRRRRYTQTVLPVGTDIYLFGSAQPSQRTEMVESQGDLLEVRRDSETGEFLVADSSEQQIQRRYSRRGPIETVAGIVLSAVALYLLLSRYVA